MLKRQILNILRLFLSASLALILLITLLRHHSFLTLCAGICIFLFAMTLLQSAFKALSGGILDSILNKVANKNYKAFLFGFSLSTIVQSSGLVSVLAISFLGAGLISLSAGVAMIYGVNLSTALSAWLVGYLGVKSSLSFYAMPLIIFGMIFYLNKNQRVKGLGLLLLSLGFLFLGISYMKEGFENFKDSVDISAYQMQGFLGLIVYVIIGIIITSLTQSSHATLTLAITALSVGQVSYENAVGVAIGANIGSTVMTIIGSIGSNANGKKIVVTHVLFNVIAALLSIIFIKYYLIATEFLALKMGIADDNYVLKLATFTTLFNVIAVLLLYPFIKQMCSFLNKVVKQKVQDFEKPLYLNESALEFSESAKKVLYLETGHLFSNTLSIVAQMVSVYPSDIYSKDDVQNLIKMRNKPLQSNFDDLYAKKFKIVYSDIIDFAVRASAANNATDFVDIRRANLFLATAVKDSKNLQVNILKYAFSTSSQNVRDEYDHLRRNMLRILRLVDELAHSKDEKRIEELHEELDVNFKKYDAISSNSLDSLIRYKRITDTLASSIMNDMALCRSIAKDLIRAAQVLSAGGKFAEEQEILDKEEKAQPKA